MKNPILVLVAIIMMLQGCVNLQEQMEKANKMTSIVESSCSCDDISFNMTNTGGYDEIECKLVGCEFNSIDSLSDQILIKLKQQIPNICETYEINFVFINKGQARLVSYQKCEKVNQ